MRFRISSWLASAGALCLGFILWACTLAIAHAAQRDEIIVFFNATTTSVSDAS